MGLSDDDKEIINTLVDYLLHADFEENGVFKKEEFTAFYGNLTDYQREAIEYYSKRHRKRWRKLMKSVGSN